ncbi:MAG: T9SS type A sorting domain-containing protein [Paludibacter sp.]|nr:T9SS type A sorting domain-containing protein [Paludibacter sp.]
MKSIQSMQNLVFICLTFISLSIYANDFVPGEGGSLPSFQEFTSEEGKIAGLMIVSCDRTNYFLSSGTVAEVYMTFPYPSEFEADSAKLQYENENGQWADYLYYNEELTTDGDNFCFYIYSNTNFRIMLMGGPKNGYTSNAQLAIVSNVDTYFSSSYLDESMAISGVMSPWTGRGLSAEFTAKKLSDYSEVEGGIAYQWYRVNPATYEAAPIANATGQTYITTEEDAGYKILVRGTGDEVTVGGFYQMISWGNTLYSNKGFISNLTNTGFTLNLYKGIDNLSITDVTLYDVDYNEVFIDEITKVSPAIYNFRVNLSIDKNPYFLENKSSFWRICTEMSFGEGMGYLMEGISIDLTATENLSPTCKFKVYVKGNTLYYQSTDIVEKIRMIDSSGKCIINTNPGKTSGAINLPEYKQGFFMLQIKQRQGYKSFKIVI